MENRNHRALDNEMIALFLIFIMVLAPLMALAAASPMEEDADSLGRSNGGPRAQGDWARFRYGPDGNSVSTSQGPTSDKDYWSNTTGGQIYGSPVISDGRLFVGSTNGRLYAFDADTGEKLWDNTTNANDFGIASTPIISNGYAIMYSNGDDDLYSFNVTTGERRWTADLGSGAYGGSSPAVDNGKVYVGSSSGALYVINEVSGTEAWNYPIGASGQNGYGIESSPTVKDGLVYFGAGDDMFRAVNVSTHALDWEYPLTERGYSSAAVVNNVVYTAEGRYNRGACATCSVYAFDVDGFSDGNDGWTGEASTGATDGDVIWSSSTPGHMIASPTIYKGYLYIGSSDHTFYALNASDGSTEWSYTAGDDIVSTAAVSNDIVYVASYDHKVYAFDYNGFADGNDGWTGETSTGSTDGDILWNYTLDQVSWSSPSLSNGILYIADISNKVYAIGEPFIDTVPPQVLATTPLDQSVDVTLDVTLQAHLSEALNPVSATVTNFTLEDNSSNLVSGVVSFDGASNNISFDPDTALLPHEEYTVTITSLMDLVGNSMSAPFTWSFTTMNHGPTLTQGQVSPSTGNETTLFEFSVVYTDIDDDAPSINVSMELDGGPSNPMVLNTSASGILMDGDFTNGERYIYSTTISTGGDHSFLFNATDGFDINLTKEHTGPHVETQNMPPVIGNVPDQNATESVLVSIDLGPFISDPDNVLDDLIMNVSSDYLIQKTTFNATFLFDSTANATEIVRFTITDGVNLVSKDVNFLVTFIDDPPSISPLPDVTVEPGVDHIIDLNSYVSDPDTDEGNLSLTTNSTYISVDGWNLTLNYPNQISMELVNLSVSDLTTTVHDEFLVDVNNHAQNTGPQIDPLPDATPTEDLPYTYDLSAYITDDGLPSNSLTVTEGSEFVSVSGLILNMQYPNGIDSEILVIEVSDGELSANTRLNVIVTPVNDAPSLTGGKVTEVFKEGSKKVVETYRFSVTYIDIDSPSPTVQLVLDGVTYAMSGTGGDNINGTLYTYNVSRKDLKKGTHEYKFLADDNSGSANSKAETATRDLDVKAMDSDPKGPSILGSMLPLMVVVVIAAIAVVLTIVMLRRKKKKGDTLPLQSNGPSQLDLITPTEQPPPTQTPPQQPQQYSDSQQPSWDPNQPSRDPNQPSQDPNQPSQDPNQPSRDPNQPSRDQPPTQTRSPQQPPY